MSGSYFPCTKCKAGTSHMTGLCASCRKTKCRDCKREFTPMKGLKVCSQCNGKRAIRKCDIQRMGGFTGLSGYEL